ncbi:heterogeneous nuclear ribonucleoprotein-related [Anaeramoeba flamelloides]|uniref:Heterogeneous nuclear ribonucleoprotein-related n=1 Tax=Anaeramoeba flamelloides TaxID=1746091 RepID=A0ABQ8Z422_9EUKA|nr:heterogeneous nuclear ribonucleoprotein-related [Anaeramoeba flamelloides]
MENNFLKVINIFDKSPQPSNEKTHIKTNPQIQINRKPKIINLDPEPKNATNQTPKSKSKPKTKKIPQPNYFRLQLSTPEPQVNYPVVDLSLKKTNLFQQKKIQSKVSNPNENKVTKKRKYRNQQQIKIITKSKTKTRTNTKTITNTKIITKSKTNPKLLQKTQTNTKTKFLSNTKPKANIIPKTKINQQNPIKTAKSFLFLNTDHSLESLTNSNQKTFQIFISGLNFDSKEQDVLNYFSKYDQAISAKLVYNKNGKKTGQAFVTYRTQEEANRAVHFYHKQTMMSRWLWVRLSNDDRTITRPKKKFRSNKSRNATRKVHITQKTKTISLDNNMTKNNRNNYRKQKIKNTNNWNNNRNSSYSNHIINTDNEKSNLNITKCNFKQNKNHFSKPNKNIGSKLIDLTALFK